MIVSASLFQKKGEDYNNMEQISIIERFPYPFQVSPRHAPFTSLLRVAAGGQGPALHRGEDSKEDTGTSTASFWGCPYPASGRLVSPCGHHGMGQLSFRGDGKRLRASSRSFRFPGRCWRDAPCPLLAQPPAQLPALAGTPAHRKSEKEVESLGGGGLFITSLSWSREHHGARAHRLVLCTGCSGCPRAPRAPSPVDVYCPQVVYDEGPLYVFSPTEELRKRWIHQLKSGESGPPRLPVRAIGSRRLRVQRDSDSGFPGARCLVVTLSHICGRASSIRSCSHDERSHEAVPYVRGW